MKKYLFIFLSIVVFSLLGIFIAYLRVDVASVGDFFAGLKQSRHMLQELLIFFSVFYISYLLIHFGASIALYLFPLKKHPARLNIILIFNSFTAFTFSFYWATSMQWDQYLR